jgi:hypothetical protein
MCGGAEQRFSGLQRHRGGSAWTNLRSLFDCGDYRFIPELGTTGPP